MRIVISSVGHMGTLGQCLGVADRIARRNALAQIPTRITRSSTWKTLLARIIPARFYEVDLVLSCGDAGERRARRLLGFRKATVWAHIEVPDQNRADDPDLVFVSNHDWRPEYDARPAYRRMQGVPHRISREALASARPGARQRLGVGDGQVVAVLLGGPNPAFAFDAQAVERVMAAILENAAGSTVLATVSRRSDPLMIRTLRDLDHANFRLLADDPDFSYLDMLAAADSVLVSEDSITMICEALATERPVRLLALSAIPGERLEKFRRFQRHFIDELNILRFYDGLPTDENAPDENALDDTAFVADEILAKLAG